MSEQSKKLRQLMARTDRTRPIFHPPSASHARIMEQAGCELAFVGTGQVVGSYTGMADVGAIDMMECVNIAGAIARSVNFPVMVDGDTGHGGVMAVRRLVRECIRAGIAGIRIDDQPLEGKRRTGSAGLEVVSLEAALTRYRAAVEMRDELDPDFVIMSQCYARDASNGGLEDTLTRLAAYHDVAGVDWVQLEAPHSVEEIRAARAAVKCTFSFMKGPMPRYLSLEEHRELGVYFAWFPSFTHHVMWAALTDFMHDFQERGLAAWESFETTRASRPYLKPVIGPEGEGGDKQNALENRYHEMFKRYAKD